MKSYIALGKLLWTMNEYYQECLSKPETKIFIFLPAISYVNPRKKRIS